MGTRITDLPAATIVNSTDVAPIVQSGTTKQAAISLIKTTNASELTSGTVAVTRLPTATTSSAGIAQFGSTSGTACEGSDVRLSNSRTPTGSAGGDLTGTYPNPTLAALSPSPAGVFGSANSIPQITVNNKGQVTSVTAVTPTATVSSVNVSGGTTGLTFSNGPITSAGTIVAAGTLAIPNGGTGATTAEGVRANLGLAPSATIDTTNASNIATGTLNAVRLSDSGATAGTYGGSSSVAQITVDSKGRVTNAVDVPIATGSVTSVGVTSSSLTVSNSPITTSGNINIELSSITASQLPASGVSAGTYGSASSIPNITVDSKGRVTSASTSTLNASNITTGTLTTACLPALTGDVTAPIGTGDTTLVASGVAAGTYGSSATVPQITVDSKGRVTSATNVGISGSAGGTVTSVGVTSNTLAISSSPITISGNIGIELNSITTAQLPASDAAPGTYGSSAQVPVIGLDSKGRVISIATAAISSLSPSGVTPGTYGSSTSVGAFSVDGNGIVTGATSQAIALTTAQISGLAASATTDTTNASNITSGALPSAQLPASGVTTGSYGSSTTIPVINVDEKGRLTNVSTAAIAGLGPSGVTAGTYGNTNSVALFAVNSTGVITGATNQVIALTTAQISGLAASATTDTTNASNISSGTLGSARLPASGVTAGSFGSSSFVPVLTIDSTGRITSASTAPVATGAGVSSFSGGTTGLTPNTATAGAITLAGTLAIANGGTGANTAANALMSLGAYPSSNPNGYTNNTGTVTSVGGTGTVSGLSLSGSVTTSGNLTLGGALAVTPSNFASQTANTVLAAPNGSTGTPTFRSLVAADFPASGVTAGTYGSTSAVPVLTVDASGRLTSVSTATITPGGTPTTVGYLRETITTSATAATGTINLDVLTQPTLYYTSNATGNFTPNIRGDAGTTLDSLLTTSQSITVTFLNTNGTTAYGVSALNVDGAARTVKWLSGTGSIPTPNASSIDAWTFTIIKTASNTFTVLGSLSKFF